MVKIKCRIILILLCLLCAKSGASTHWVVTENGRIQSQLNSPFHLRRPYDLIALLDQETRRTNITLLYNEMHNRKNVIDKKWSGIEGAAEVEARIHSQDPYCLRAELLLSEVDLYNSIASNGSDRVDITFENVSDTSKNYLIPDCTTFSTVPYSMCAFEHLNSMVKRSGLSIPQEIHLYSFLPVESVDVFGHGVFLELQKNTTSWVHYNLAVLYWRIKGNAYNAIECGRRALHFVSRQYRDIPLLTLADVLHQSQQPKDAAVLLHAALRHSPDTYINYIALGNTYAVQYDYNRSVACYDIALNKNPKLDDIAESKYALLCHKSLDEGLLKLHDSLQAILTDLHDYHSLQQQWLRLQERLLWEQTPADIQHTSEKHTTGQRCVQRMSYDDSQPRITCDFTDHDSAAQFQADITLNFQKLLHNVESETKKISAQLVRTKYRRTTPGRKKSTKPAVEKPLPEEDCASVENDDDKMPPILHPTYPLTLSPSRNLYFDISGWPSRAECSLWNLPLTEHDDLDIPVFLPPENKGFQVSKMLTDYIGLSSGQEHSLPWHPPVCRDGPRDVEKFYLPSSWRQLTTALKSHPLMKEHFLNYVRNGKAEESEIGQRIVTAMQKKAGPEWVLATLASLYWRLRSNTKNALNCLDVAFQTVSKGSTDVILISIASILYQLGFINEATRYAKLAFKVNFYEPSTNFLLAMLHYRSNNPILAMYYMKNVLRIEPDYYDGKADELLRTWSCRIKMGAYEDLKMKTSKINQETTACPSESEQCIQFQSCHNIEKRFITKGEHCNGKFISQVDWSSFVANEVLRYSEADPIAIEIADQPQAFHMKVTPGPSSLGEFYISAVFTNDGFPEAILNVQDTSGTYALSTPVCLAMKSIDWYLIHSKWQFITSRNINIQHLLKPVPHNTKSDLQPECLEPSKSTTILDRLNKILKKKLRDTPEESMGNWLQTMAGDDINSIPELGRQIHLALQENEKSWLLATAASIYWHIIGDSSKVVTCLRQSLANVPSDMMDVPLISMSNMFLRSGLLNDALEIALLAFETNPEYVVNRFTVGNVYAAMGNLEKAISFYRLSLASDSVFVPAQARIIEILCTLFYDENGIMKDITNFQ